MIPQDAERPLSPMEKILLAGLLNFAALYVAPTVVALDGLIRRFDGELPAENFDEFRDGLMEDVEGDLASAKS